MERSLIIFKPDCMSQNVVGKVIDRFAEAGFRMAACKMIQLDDEMLKKHYSHHADKPYFPEIVNFMKSTPVVVSIFEGEGVIGKIRDLLGPTDSAAAEKGTIRGDYGTGKMENIAHASDSPEAAAEEIERFFSANELF